MPHPAFVEAMRRVVSGEDAAQRSCIVIDGPPPGEYGSPGVGGLFEIWHEAFGEPLDPSDVRDRGEPQSVLSPARGHVKVRWFVIEPSPPDIPAEFKKQRVREVFADIDAAHELRDQDRHPAMHQTSTLDIICLVAGDASLVLDDVETRLRPGQVVIQRGTSHAWLAHGGPALFLAVLIDRTVRAAAGRP